MEVVELRDLVLPGDANHYGTLFGGKALEMMDKAAGMAASKFTKANTVTASVGAVHFHQPILMGETILVKAKVVDAGSRVVTVKVGVFKENYFTGTTIHCTTGYFNMVPVDANLRPISVENHGVLPEANEESMKARGLRETMVNESKVLRKELTTPDDF